MFENLLIAHVFENFEFLKFITYIFIFHFLVKYLHLYTPQVIILLLCSCRSWLNHILTLNDQIVFEQLLLALLLLVYIYIHTFSTSVRSLILPHHDLSMLLGNIRDCCLCLISLWFCVIALELNLSNTVMDICPFKCLQAYFLEDAILFLQEKLQNRSFRW